MKILHLFSDWKWTGPAEPTLSLCEALTNEGVDVTLAYRKTPEEFRERTVEKEIKKRNIKSYDGFRLNRYFSLKDWLHDAGAIQTYVRKNDIDIVHAHLSHDYLTAFFSLTLMKNRPLIVRSDHKRDGMPVNKFMVWAMSRTDGLVSYSKKNIDQDIKAYNFPVEKTCVVPPGIKPYEGPVKDMRDEIGLKRGEKAIGVIGRLKPDRGYDVILKAFKTVKEHIGPVKLIIMGRSSQIEKSIKQPLLELGIEKDVILAGYRVDDYFSMIAMFDLFLMMRAGSDGSARALREVMAMGKPAIVSDMGMLPELVEDGKTGYVVKLEADDLAGKMAAILTDEQKRIVFGANAKKAALEKWNYDRQAKKMADFYRKLLVMKS
jgi:glycosyltransferase involved in cell wall biosynthesis